MSLKLLGVRKSFPATEHPADTICRVSERSSAPTPLTRCVCMMLMEESLVLVPAATHTHTLFYSWTDVCVTTDKRRTVFQRAEGSHQRLMIC